MTNRDPEGGFTLALIVGTIVAVTILIIFANAIARSHSGSH